MRPCILLSMVSWLWTSAKFDRLVSSFLIKFNDTQVKGIEYSILIWEWFFCDLLEAGIDIFYLLYTWLSWSPHHNCRAWQQVVFLRIHCSGYFFMLAETVQIPTLLFLGWVHHIFSLIGQCMPVFDRIVNHVRDAVLHHAHFWRCFLYDMNGK